MFLLFLVPGGGTGVRSILLFHRSFAWIAHGHFNGFFVFDFALLFDVHIRVVWDGFEFCRDGDCLGCQGRSRFLLDAIVLVVVVIMLLMCAFLLLLFGRVLAAG